MRGRRAFRIRPHRGTGAMRATKRPLDYPWDPVRRLPARPVSMGSAHLQLLATRPPSAMASAGSSSQPT
eukprot:3182383-Heterocapsa_arctica.AAC.1